MLSSTELTRRKSQPIAVATAYDFPFAALLEKAGIDVILVGDSAANVVLGLDSTREIGMEEMLLFVQAVVRGAPHTHVVADLPLGSDATPESAVQNALRFQKLGAASVKLEGAKVDAVRVLIKSGIPVMGHLGVTPQTAVSFRRVGKTEESRAQLLRDAQALEQAGAFALVLENVEEETAAILTSALSIPTIGIGSGKRVNGQVQVLHDLLGLTAKPPPFATAFGDLHEQALRAMKAYIDAVRGG